MLMPTLGAAKKYTYQTMCLYNARTITAAHMLYAEDYDGRSTAPCWWRPDSDGYMVKQSWKDTLGITGHMPSRVGADYWKSAEVQTINGYWNRRDKGAWGCPAWLRSGAWTPSMAPP